MDKKEPIMYVTPAQEFLEVDTEGFLCKKDASVYVPLVIRADGASSRTSHSFDRRRQQSLRKGKDHTEHYLLYSCGNRSVLFYQE